MTNFDKMADAILIKLNNLFFYFSYYGYNFGNSPQKS
jgi:hypothetical protein